MKKAKNGSAERPDDKKAQGAGTPEADGKKLEQYIQSVKHLPPAPKMIVELLPLFNQPDRDVDRIVMLLCHDPSFTAEILKSCNTAYFSGGVPCMDMFDAIQHSTPNIQGGGNGETASRRIGEPDT